MRRQLFGWMLVGSGALAGLTASGRQGQDFSNVEIKASKVSGNIYKHN